MHAGNPTSPMPRRRTTRWSVRVGDRLAGIVIRVGGIATIGAVLTVFLFLLWVVLPLFRPAELSLSAAVETRLAAKELRAVIADEYGQLAWCLGHAGAEILLLNNGQVLPAPTAIPPLRAVAPGEIANRRVCALADGSVRAVEFGFSSDLIAASEIPEAIKSGGRSAWADGALFTPISPAEFRKQLPHLAADDVLLPAGAEQPTLLDSTSSPIGTLLLTYVPGELKCRSIRSRKNALTGEVARSEQASTVAIAPRAGSEPVGLFLLSGHACLVWSDGLIERFALEGGHRLTLGEQATPRRNVRISATALLPGRGTLLVGDEAGGVGVWFVATSEEAQSRDGVFLVEARRLETASAEPVVAIATSQRRRMAIVAHRDGLLELFNITTGERLASTRLNTGAPVALALAPRDDLALAVSLTACTPIAVNAAYPEVSWRSLTWPLWYEGYPEPAHVWQSSSGSDDFEPKLGFWPLIFGTLKATFYALLLAVPLALAAAVYTSEFMRPQLRARVKPLIELMASLPSVVLGFFAGLIWAPWVEERLAHVLCTVYLLPALIYLAASIWQTLPTPILVRAAPLRPVLVAALLLCGVVLAGPLGHAIERWLFLGDIKLWLDGKDRLGRGAGGWLMLALPPAVLVVAALVVRVANPRLRVWLLGRSRGQAIMVELVKSFSALLAVGALAWTLALIGEASGVDPRGGVLDSYTQRNALIVGFAMGFAVVPIIYTLADDALTAVPENLRSASLGAGATPWQTAIRIVIPTATSGLFSAVMVGLGRAVGETMIVLMAAGNTPVTDWNIFNGFRTLSANIAVELPEAAQNGAHYRTLFLAALVLFTMTFIINTAAEFVRQRVRTRRAEL